MLQFIRKWTWRIKVSTHCVNQRMTTETNCYPYLDQETLWCMQATSQRFVVTLKCHCFEMKSSLFLLSVTIILTTQEMTMSLVSSEEVDSVTIMAFKASKKDKKAICHSPPVILIFLLYWPVSTFLSNSCSTFSWIISCCSWNTWSVLC